jgi:O-antigen/teichoic acid export membrane protein
MSTAEERESPPPDLRALRTKLLRGGGWVFGGRAAGVVVAILANALLARLLPPSALGAYFLTMAVASTTGAFLSLGLPGAVLRFASHARGSGDPGRARRAVLLSFSWGAGAAAVAAILLASGAGAFVSRVAFRSEVMAAVMPLAAVWLFLMAMQTLQAEAFRGLHDIRDATIFGGVLTSALNAAVYGVLRMIYGHVSLATVVLAASAVLATTLTAGAFLMRKQLVASVPIRDLRSRELLRTSAPLWLSGATAFIVGQADLWILGVFQPASTVAVYGAAARLAIYLSMPLMLVNAVVPPIAGEMHARGEHQQLQRLLQATAAVAMIPALAVVALLAVFGEDILGLIFGEPYRVGAPILLLLGVGQLASVLSGSCGVALLMTGNERSVMVSGVTAATVMIGLALVLVRTWGETGVAVATSSGLIVQNATRWWFAKRHAGLDTHASFVELARLIRARH